MKQCLFKIRGCFHPFAITVCNTVLPCSKAELDRLGINNTYDEYYTNLSARSAAVSNNESTVAMTLPSALP